MSLFHSVTPDRHGILTNAYVPQVRPVQGLCEVLRVRKRSCAFFYNWEQLKDLSRPGSLAHADFISGYFHGYDASNLRLTDDAIAYIQSDSPDFVFLYLGCVDEVGHDSGWMGPKYLESVAQSLDCIEKVIKSLPPEYCALITADHGGHERSHGTELPEDMTIPLFLFHPAFSGGPLPAQTSILDIAPTIAALCGVEADEDWEGKALALD